MNIADFNLPMPSGLTSEVTARLGYDAAYGTGQYVEVGDVVTMLGWVDRPDPMLGVVTRVDRTVNTGSPVAWVTWNDPETPGYSNVYHPGKLALIRRG